MITEYEYQRAKRKIKHGYKPREMDKQAEEELKKATKPPIKSDKKVV